MSSLAVPADIRRLADHPYLSRLGKGLLLAILIGLAVVNLRWALDGIKFDDFESYWSAALRLRNGEPLYPLYTDIDLSEIYRYSPWFAWAWVPLTFLPRALATAIWIGILAVAAGYLGARMVQLRAWFLLLLFGPLLVDSVLGANVQVLMVALLAWGVERRAGPLCIAFAASLKAVPLLLVLVYLGRRQWMRAGISVVVTGILLAPFLLYDLSNYITDPGAYTFLYGTILYMPLAALSVAATFLLARTRYAWLAGATAIVLTLPRIWTYHLTFLLVPLAGIGPGQERDQEIRSRRLARARRSGSA